MGKQITLLNFLSIVIDYCGGSVAEWLGRRTWNPEVTGSSFALTT